MLELKKGVLTKVIQKEKASNPRRRACSKKTIWKESESQMKYDEKKYKIGHEYYSIENHIFLEISRKCLIKEWGKIKKTRC